MLINVPSYSTLAVAFLFVLGAEKSMLHLPDFANFNMSNDVTNTASTSQI
jgi:hypothetical protein